MIFSDAEFLLLFFPFTALVIRAAQLTGSRMVTAAVIIGCSFGFYMQWNPQDFVVVISSITLNFLIANAGFLSQRLRLGLCVGINVGYLFFLKYIVATGLISTAGQAAGNLFGTLGLPLGISFITFQQIGFVVDQVEGRDREPNFLRYLFFVLFYPHLVAGPLVPHRLLCAQIDRRPFLRPSMTFLKVGFAYLAVGMVKKLMIAEPLSLVNNELFRASAELSMPEAWFNAVLYSFRIYFDFSAYSDLATGIAYLMGIQFPRNFISPYKATNIFEFWRSWHVSLYKFFRQYLYLRLIRIPLFRRQAPLAILVVMILSAMWHGVGWGYLLWGLGHAGVMIATRAALKAGWAGRGGLPWLGRLGAVTLTFALVTLLWVPFALNDLGLIGLYFGRLFSFTAGLGHLPPIRWATLALPALIVFLLPNSHQLCLGNRHRPWLPWLALLLFALALPLAVGRAAPSPPFIYFQF
jgi:D-alanyl-lipoteichoic acid acyltransferase DltB (MBOAT superfamily)